MYSPTDLLAALAAPPTGRSRRISSNEQPNWNDGNFDMTRLAPGETFELPVLDGPGVIQHIWMTSHSGGVNELDALTLRIYWDGRSEPAVEAPLGMFFAVGQGTPAVVESLPVQVSPTGSLTCFWRMPFRKSARIVVTNDNPDRSTGLYWQVDWLSVDSLPSDTPYFYARYRQEYPAASGRDYLIADIEGAGRYVGTVMAVTLAQDGWFGEGDDFFFIDGEEIPSLQGTGTEDYFNDAWGFRPRTSLWFGQPRWQGWKAGDSGACYRWHVLDPVHFSRSLRLAIEHKGNRENPEEAWYIERPDFFASVAFWYQQGEPKPFGIVPSWQERRVPWLDVHLVPALRHARVTGAAGPTVETTGFFGGRPVLAWSGKSGASLSLPFSVPAEGRYAARLQAFSAPEYGRFAARIKDSAPAVDVDAHSAEPDERDWLLGTFELSAGPHHLTLQPAPARGQAASIALERLRLLKLPPEAVREVRNENEAHFVRMAIGRAVYAHKLAYGRVPESLEELIRCGLLTDRYLQDENGFRVESRREGDYLVAESSGPGGWKHRWQGLDARR